MAGIRVVDQDGDVVELEVDLAQGVLTVIAGVRLRDNVVILYNVHVEGPGPGTVGVSDLRDVVRQVMEKYDVDSLEIHGYRRTTGANPGRTPSPFRFRRR